MAAALVGRGVVRCRPDLQQPRSADSSPHDEVHHDALGLERTNLHQTAAGKGGNAGLPNHEDVSPCTACTDLQILTHHPPTMHIDERGTRRRRGKRLGEKELGPYHAEPQMPSALLERLATRDIKQTQHMDLHTGQLYRVATASNELRNVMPTLAYLFHCLPAVAENPLQKIETVTLCHPCVRHVFKTPSEGGFCGYRNAQTLCSFIAGTNWRAAGEQVLTREKKWRAKSPDMLPGVLELQRMIEVAWDMGINAHCREETGGLVGRRVYIGSPEVQSLLLSLGIPAATYSVTEESDLPAHEALIETVVRHFRPYVAPHAAGLVQELLPSGGTLNKTVAPPLFLQQPGHSLTIVGYQRQADSSTSLIVLDPGYAANLTVRDIAGRLARPRPCSNMPYSVDSGWEKFNSTQLQYLGKVRENAPRTAKKVRGDVEPADAEKLLKVYQRGADKLRRYKEFELVILE